MRVFIGSVFIYAAWGKLMAPAENFQAVIEGYHFLKPPFVSFVARFFPWLELIFGVFLAAGFLTKKMQSNPTPAPEEEYVFHTKPVDNQPNPLKNRPKS